MKLNGLTGEKDRNIFTTKQCLRVRNIICTFIAIDGIETLQYLHDNVFLITPELGEILKSKPCNIRYSNFPLTTQTALYAKRRSLELQAPKIC